MIREERKIGLLGLGSRSTLFYIEQLNLLYNKSHGTYSTCPFILLNANFDKINQFLPNNFDQLISVTQQYLNDLESLNVRRIIVPNITLHETIDKLPFNSLIVHPVTLLINRLKEDLVKSVIIFGTDYTMSSNYISTILIKNNIKVGSLLKEEKEIINELRLNVYDKKETKLDYFMFQKIINNYPTHQLIIACTELSSILKFVNSDRVCDLSQLQIEAALED